jgi:hypothetical protein
MLHGLLLRLGEQDTWVAGQRLRLRVVVVDNDATASARRTALAGAAQAGLSLHYLVEPQRNIAQARNRAVQGALDGPCELLAFIDDDEVPPRDWLANAWLACTHWQADGVLAPVRPLYDDTPPRWLLRSGLCERAEYPTGHRLTWRETRTGNVLLTRACLLRLYPPGTPPSTGTPFDTRYRDGGEDTDFFRRLLDTGAQLVWSREAAVCERVPRARCQRRYHLRRGWLRGLHDRALTTPRQVTISLLALAIYALLLPIAALAGQHRAMQVAVRLCDHAGRVAGVLGWWAPAHAPVHTPVHPPFPMPDRQRDPTLDALKGALLLVIVLYHAMNYFGDLPASVYGWLRFGNGGFVFLAGAALALRATSGKGRGIDNGPGPATRDAPGGSDASFTLWDSVRRPLRRGAWLLLLFTLINLAIALAGLTSYRQVHYDLGAFASHWLGIYVRGDADEAAFRILVPISYLFMVSGFYLHLHRHRTGTPVARRLWAVLTSATLGLALACTTLWPGLPLPFFLCTGLAGLSLALLGRDIEARGHAAGLTAPHFWLDPLQQRIDNKGAQHPGHSIRLITLGGVTAAVLCSQMNALSGNALTYAVGLGLLLSLCYAGLRLPDRRSALLRGTSLLGRHTLAAYVGQIGVLFALHRLVPPSWRDGAWAWPLAFAFTSVVLLLACLAVERLGAASLAQLVTAWRWRPGTTPRPHPALGTRSSE